MNPTPSSLVAERTDQIRTFVTVEAAMDTVPARRPGLSTHRRRRLAVGVVAAVLLGLVAVVAGSIGGPAPSSVAFETADGWTTIRLVDIDADADAVVAELQGAGFDAERRDSVDLSTPTLSDGVTVVAVDVIEPGEDPWTGSTALSVELHTPLTEAFPPGDTPVDEGFEAQGVRFASSGEVSLRHGADVTLLVVSGD